jgi:hypothetical protein
MHTSGRAPFPRIKIGVEQSAYTPNVTLGSSCPIDRANAVTFTPALIEMDAQSWRKSCGLIFSTSAGLTAADLPIYSWPNPRVVVLSADGVQGHRWNPTRTAGFRT